MTFEEAKKLLSASIRSECRDHAFGDREVFWEDGNGDEVGGGYFGGGGGSVWIFGTDYAWAGSEARELSRCGTVGAIDRNDSTGPDEYRDGQIMPSLTFDGVLKEICTPHPADVGDPDMDEGEWSWNG